MKLICLPSNFIFLGQGQERVSRYVMGNESKQKREKILSKSD